MPTETADSNITPFKNLMRSPLNWRAYCQENGFPALKAPSRNRLQAPGQHFQSRWGLGLERLPDVGRELWTAAGIATLTPLETTFACWVRHLASILFLKLLLREFPFHHTYFHNSSFQFTALLLESRSHLKAVRHGLRNRGCRCTTTYPIRCRGGVCMGPNKHALKLIRGLLMTMVRILQHQWLAPLSLASGFLWGATGFPKSHSSVVEQGFGTSA